MKAEKILFAIMFFTAAAVQCQNAFTLRFNRFAGTFFNATLFNKNVYKAKINLQVESVYQDINKLSGTTNGSPGIFNVTVLQDGVDFIRYKEIKREDDYAYIRFLPGCRFNGNTIVKCSPGQSDDVNDLIFRYDASNFDPAGRYLASSMLVGNLLVLPLKIRQKYSDHSSMDFQTDVNVNYAFGWKVKLGNHPYHNHYLNVIPYAFGMGAQDYIAKTGEFNEDGSPKYTEATTQIAFTYWCSGISYEYERFNIGYFVGSDAMLKPNKNWVYQRQIWHGIGIGYDLFKAGE